MPYLQPDADVGLQPRFEVRPWREHRNLLPATIVCGPVEWENTDQSVADSISLSMVKGTRYVEMHNTLENRVVSTEEPSDPLISTDSTPFPTLSCIFIAEMCIRCSLEDVYAWKQPGATITPSTVRGVIQAIKMHNTLQD
jgi:hypothetical protein